MSQNSRRMKRIVGANSTRRLCHHGAPVSSGRALTTTPFCSRSPDRASLSAKAGISVRNRVVGFLSSYVIFWVNVPWIAVPFDMISLTWPAFTCFRKKGLYGTRTRDSGCVTREPREKFKARSASAKTIQARLIRGKRGGEGVDPRGDGGALSFWR